MLNMQIQKYLILTIQTMKHVMKHVMKRYTVVVEISRTSTSTSTSATASASASARAAAASAFSAFAFAFRRLSMFASLFVGGRGCADSGVGGAKLRSFGSAPSVYCVAVSDWRFQKSGGVAGFAHAGLRRRCFEHLFTFASRRRHGDIRGASHVVRGFAWNNVT